MNDLQETPRDSLSQGRKWTAAVLIVLMALMTAGVVLLLVTLRVPPLEGAREETERFLAVTLLAWGIAMAIGIGLVVLLWRWRRRVA